MALLSTLENRVCGPLESSYELLQVVKSDLTEFDNGDDEYKANILYLTKQMNELIPARPYDQLMEAFRRSHASEDARIRYKYLYQRFLEIVLSNNNFAKLSFDSLHYTFKQPWYITRFVPYYEGEDISIDSPLYMDRNLFFPVPRTIRQLKELMRLSAFGRSSLVATDDGTSETSFAVCKAGRQQCARFRARWYLWPRLRALYRFRTLAFWWYARFYNAEEHKKEDIENARKDLGDLGLLMHDD